MDLFCERTPAPFLWKLPSRAAYAFYGGSYAKKRAAPRYGMGETFGSAFAPVFYSITGLAPHSETQWPNPLQR